MRKWFKILITLITINIILIVTHHIIITIELNKYDMQISKYELIIQKRETVIQELHRIKLHLDSLEMKLDTALAVRLKEQRKKSITINNRTQNKKVNKDIQTNATTSHLTTSLKISASDSTDSTVQFGSNNTRVDSSLPISKSKLLYSDGLFYGISGFYSKNRKKEIIKKNDREFWIEIESRYSLLSGVIKKVTINGEEIEIKEVLEEEKESMGKKVKFTYLLSYFVLVRVERNLLIDGKNKVVVHADIDYEKSLYIE